MSGVATTRIGTARPTIPAVKAGKSYGNCGFVPNVPRGFDVAAALQTDKQHCGACAIAWEYASSGDGISNADDVGHQKLAARPAVDHHLHRIIQSELLLRGIIARPAATPEFREGFHAAVLKIDNPVDRNAGPRVDPPLFAVDVHRCICGFN